jgi:hypothetical protein
MHECRALSLIIAFLDFAEDGGQQPADTEREPVSKDRQNERSEGGRLNRP